MPNSSLQTDPPVTVQTWLIQATAQLSRAGITTARLDALVLLEHVLRQNRAWLLAHPEYSLPAAPYQKLAALLERRQQREPIAYLLGQKEFYGRPFMVTPDTLIPRPETEQLVELLLALPLPARAAVLDVGTGSGAIAITAKLERPEFRVWASDISEGALAIARQNAQGLHADVTYFRANLLRQEEDAQKPHATPQPAQPALLDAIIANLPYVAPGSPVSPETAFEPTKALYALDDGLSLIKNLIMQAPARLVAGGYLLLEAELRQHPAIAHFAAGYGFVPEVQDGFCQVLRLNTRRTLQPVEQ